MDDQEIIHKIGAILCASAPEAARKILVKAAIFPEIDGGEYEFDYLDEKGNLDFFDPDGRAIGDLTEVLVEYKKFFINTNLTNGKAIWTKCLITADVSQQKISLEFQYDG